MATGTIIAIKGRWLTVRDGDNTLYLMAGNHHSYKVGDTVTYQYVNGANRIR